VTLLNSQCTFTRTEIDDTQRSVKNYNKVLVFTVRLGAVKVGAEPLGSQKTYRHIDFGEDGLDCFRRKPKNLQTTDYSKQLVRDNKYDETGNNLGSCLEITSYMRN
jgi:hypothetical protein